MKAWKALEPESVVLEQYEPEKVGKNEVKIKMLASSISETDILIYSGKLGMKPFPIILGRQGVGMVSEVGENVGNFKRGDRVYIRPQVYCGECSECLKGNEEKCKHAKVHGKTTDGVLRDFIVAQKNNLYKIPPYIDTQDASMLEMIALAKSAVNSLDLQVGSYVVISGASCLGLLAAQMAMSVRAVPIVLDFDEYRLRIAEKVGVYYALNISNEDVLKRIFSITSGKMAEAAVQTPPGVVAFRRLLDYVAESGKVVYTAIENTGGDLSVDMSAVLDKNVTLSTVSSHGLSITAAVNALAGDKITVSPFITRCNFSEVDEFLKKCEKDPNRYMFVSVAY
ncbi:MAG: alcohol dehydrogenase catalytic domain-containing protein [Firmicutes bacterium]|nr:alcohol dehydrogenase catalytic domain-containing protein [Bacillota bacterium]MDY5531358.1 alcohol dehydrogenase catalytic domain-containing protein [Pumilibacteraceae bacterium]